MKIENTLKSADFFNKEKDVMSIESIELERCWEHKTVKITIHGDGIKMSVNVFADDVIKAVKNATNY